MPTDRRQSMLINAARLRELHQAIHTTFACREKSATDYRAWEQACRIFGEEYEKRYYPGGHEQLKALRHCDPDAVATAVDFLQADPVFFRSGYLKEYLWRYLARCPLSREQRGRLEDAALAYTRQCVRREFWYMCRAMPRIASEGFWQDVRSRVSLAHPPDKLRLEWLAAYAEGIPAGEQLRQRIQRY